MGRSEFLRSMFDTKGKGLEIGPSHNPLMPKAAGFDVEILDYLDAEGLRRKYSEAGCDVSSVEEVDFIGDGRPMTEVIGDRGRYDWIVASHVIEHVPDLLAFLMDCEALLKPGGQLVLAVPDKRCCFDVLRPLSTLGQVLQAHVDGRRRPPPGVVFDDLAYARKRNGRIGWGIREVDPLTEVRPVEEALHFFEKIQTSQEYIDVHCWVFVPSSFRLIVSGLGSLGMTKLGVKNFQDAGGEFFAVLSAEHEKQAWDLGKLMQAAQTEERLCFPPEEERPVISEAAPDLAALRKELSEAQRLAETYAQLVNNLTNSASWKLTAPLRGLKKLARGAGG